MRQGRWTYDGEKEVAHDLSRTPNLGSSLQKGANVFVKLDQLVEVTKEGIDLFFGSDSLDTRGGAEDARLTRGLGGVEVGEKGLLVAGMDVLERAEVVLLRVVQMAYERLALLVSALSFDDLRLVVSFYNELHK